MSKSSNSFEVLTTLADGAGIAPVWKPSTKEAVKPQERYVPRKKIRASATASRTRGSAARRERLDMRTAPVAMPAVGGSAVEQHADSTNVGNPGSALAHSAAQAALHSVSRHGAAQMPRVPPQPKLVVPTSYVFTSDPNAVPAAVEALSSSSRIAVDCEGVLLSRTGKLCLIQVASSETVFMFDIAVGGRAMFDAGLRDILESPKCIKVMHDCRHDCDALMHQYNVKLEPVLDTQIAFAVLRSVRNLKVGFPVSLKTLLKKFVQVTDDDIEMKDTIKNTMREQEDFWLTRPLPPEALQYAKFDVMYLLHVAKVLALYISTVDSKGWDRVLRESAEYSRLFRDDAEGPRKEAAKWARMLTEAKTDRAIIERKKAAQELCAVDPMCVFSFKQDAVLAFFRADVGGVQGT